MSEPVAANFSKYFQLEKYDPFQGIAIGIATAEQTDRDNEILDYIKSKPYFEAWSESVHKDSGGKSFGNVRRQHDDKVVAGKLNSINFSDSEKVIRVEAKIIEPVTKDLLAEGALTGFSIGGRYVDRVKQTDGTTRYVADPCEISVVDRPALPGATFSSVKSDGSVELRKFAKYEETPAPKNEDAVVKQDASASFECIRGRVQDALDEKYGANREPEPGGKSVWVWIKDIFLDSVVYSVNPNGLGDGELYECTYQDNGEKATLSEAIEVHATYVPANKSVRYLVPDGEHLPYTDENGNISHRLMGAAWAALHGGYRGNKYEGADKDKAIARLKRLYESEGMETPSAEKSLGDAIEALKSADAADIEASNVQILELLEELEKTMADEKDLTLDKAARHSVHQKISAMKKAHTDHMAACKAHHDAMHAGLDGVAKVLGGGPESQHEGGSPEVITEGLPAGSAPQAPGASAIAAKGVKFVSVGKTADGTEIFKRVEEDRPLKLSDLHEFGKSVVKQVLEIGKASVDSIGDRTEAKPFVKAAVKTEDGPGAGNADAANKMSEKDWADYRGENGNKAQQAAMTKAQSCTSQNWKPVPSRILNREAERVGAAR